MEKKDLTFTFDPNDLGSMCELMDKYGDTDVLGDQRCVDFDFIGQLAFEGYSAVILAGASGQSAHLLTYCLAD